MQQIEIWGYGKQLVFVFGSAACLLLNLFCTHFWKGCKRSFNVDLEVQRWVVDKCCLFLFMNLEKGKQLKLWINVKLSVELPVPLKMMN